MQKKILIVDDSESMREILSFTLENAGYNVIKAESANVAMNYIYKNENLDLVITDLHMPEIDGIDLIKMIRNSDNFKYIPILFLTTETQQEKKHLAKAAGATGWVIKPFVPDSLLSAIGKVLLH